MIDLSQFVNKKVRVTFRNGCILEGKITMNTTRCTAFKPYYFECNEGDFVCGYDYAGFELDSDEPTAGDIVKIEEIETTTMNQYQQTNSQNTKMSKTPQTISDFIVLLGYIETM